METIIGGIIRALLSSLGGWLVAKGYVDADTASSLVNQLAGVAAIVVVIVWSAKNKKDQKAAVADAYAIGHSNGTVSATRELRQYPGGSVPKANAPADRYNPPAADG